MALCLSGATPGPVPACCAIVEVAPTSVTTSENISARSILVFILFLSALKHLLRHAEEAESLPGFRSPISSNFLPGIRIPPEPDLVPTIQLSRAMHLTDLYVPIRNNRPALRQGSFPIQGQSSCDNSGSLGRFSVRSKGITSGLPVIRAESGSPH